MSNEDTQVVEKRIKSTVIRRRKEAAPPTPPVVETKREATKEVAPVTTSAKTAGIPPQTFTPIQREEIKKTTEVVKSSKTAVAPVTPLPILAEEEGDDKKLKHKKVIKKKETGIEVDLEGVGRVSSITQLTRIAHADRISRVFQPSRNTGTGKRKRIITKKGMQHTPLTFTKAAKRVVDMDKTISVGNLAHAMGVKSSAVITKLMGMGTMVTINAEIDFDTATLVAQEFQFEVKDVSFNEAKVLEGKEQVKQEGESRPPVVTVMGHVDHGKTSLLDAIRKTNVTEGEAGGITQHIGAYTITLPKGSKSQGKITFLDTPGHEAFTAMRARGAKVTDIVILVVAADDGLMPQTLESIDHAKAAGVPIVVAVNKIDKPEANVDRVKRQLSEQGLSPEEWGGETQYALVSAKQKQGIDDLLEKVLLQAEVLELKANPNERAKGTVIEARLDRFRGPVVTVLINQGTLHLGDIVVAGSSWGKVKAMTNHRGEAASEAGPSVAVEILGLNAVPSASDLINVVEDEKAAKEIAGHRSQLLRDTKMIPVTKVSLEDLMSKIQKGEIKELNVILKTDVHGSLEAVSEALKKLATEKVQVRLIHSGVGGITESDVLLASSSSAVIIGFNIRPETNAIKVASSEGVQIKLYKIIYEMVDDVKLAMKGLLTPTKKENYLGRAEVRQAFVVSKVGTIAGCQVVDGKIARSAQLRLLRDNVVLFEGKMSSLKRFKDDAREVAQGMECGIGIDGYQDIKSGDVLEAFEVELIQPEL